MQRGPDGIRHPAQVVRQRGDVHGDFGRKSVSMRQQAAARDQEHLARVTLAREPEQRVEGGVTGAENRDRLFRIGSIERVEIPRIGDVAACGAVSHGLRIFGRKMAEREDDLIRRQRAAAVEGHDEAVAAGAHAGHLGGHALQRGGTAPLRAAQGELDVVAEYAPRYERARIECRVDAAQVVDEIVRLLRQCGHVSSRYVQQQVVVPVVIGEAAAEARAPVEQDHAHAPIQGAAQDVGGGEGTAQPGTDDDDHVGRGVHEFSRQAMAFSNPRSAIHALLNRRD